MFTRISMMLSLGMAIANPGVAQPVAKQGAPVAPAPVHPAASPADDPARDMLEHVKFPYRPALVRDPFHSPTDSVDKVRAESIDEVGVRGRVVHKGKRFAIVLDSRGKTRMLPVGYQFKDGEITAITDKAVVFRQWDPTSVNRTHAKVVEKQFKREEGNR